LESPREGRKKRRIEEGREIAWTPKIYDRSPPLGTGQVEVEKT